MGQSTRSTLGAVVILGGLLALLAWCVTPGPGESWIWILRIASLVMVVIPASVLVWAKSLKDKAPDFLAQVNFRYFERDGLCFGFVPELVGNQRKLSVYYQNRYDRPCTGTVWLVPTKVAFEDVSDLPEFAVEISCEGGEFGKMCRVWGPPMRYRDKSILWDVAAIAKYPQGRGVLLRLRDGLRVGKESKINAGRQLLRFVGALGHLHSEAPARVELKFPEGISFASGNANAWEKEVAWQLGDPVAA